MMMGKTGKKGIRLFPSSVVPVTTGMGDYFYVQVPPDVSNAVCAGEVNDVPATFPGSQTPGALCPTHSL